MTKFSCRHWQTTPVTCDLGKKPGETSGNLHNIMKSCRFKKLDIMFRAYPISSVVSSVHLSVHPYVPKRFLQSFLLPDTFIHLYTLIIVFFSSFVWDVSFGEWLRICELAILVLNHQNIYGRRWTADVHH